jgi:hypothetical protein
MRLWIAFFLVIVSFVSYKVIAALDLFKTYELKNDDLCTRFPLPYPAEDFVEFGGVLIGGVSDRVSLYMDKSKGPAVTPDGWLISVVPSPFSYQNLTVEGWPEGVGFQPLGMSLYNETTLLVVNLAYHRGGQRLEVLKLWMEGAVVKVQYEKSILFKAEFQGIVNSVVQTDRNEFFVTTWHPFPDEETGRAHDLWSSFTRMFYWTFFKHTYLWRCSDQDGSAQCVKVYSGKVMNGLAYINGRLYVADAGDRRVFEFKMKQDRRLVLKDKIKLNFSPDNLSVGPDNRLYATGSIVSLEAVKRLTGGSDSVATTVARLDKVGRDWEVVELYSQAVVSGASVAVPIEGYFVLGSWHDSAAGVCKQIS